MVNGGSNLEEEFYLKLIEKLEKEQILKQEPLAHHTSFKVGGPAKYLILPNSIDQVIYTIQLCEKEEIPYYVMGNGSNLLVGDKGYNGVIIKLNGSFGEISITPLDKKDKSYLVRAQAGVLLSKLATRIAKAELTGFEFAAGIPGSLGGAVTMNAGAYDGEIKNHIHSATVIDRNGSLITLSKEELELGYRTSIIQKKDYFVLEAQFIFEKGNKEEIFAKIIELNRRRQEKQPLEFPSAGSAFKRPVGHFAGKLIMDSGLKGYQIGGAQVSTKHCGFVINLGNATALDILNLLNYIKKVVYEKFGVVLEQEVKLLGDF